jgi:hypothetical protein
LVDTDKDIELKQASAPMEKDGTFNFKKLYAIGTQGVKVKAAIVFKQEEYYE